MRYLLLIIIALSSCDSCKERSECNRYISIRNNTDSYKVVLLSLDFPDTTYSCLTQKNGVSASEEVKVPCALQSCWEYELENIPLQLFVIDSVIYADSSCESLLSNTNLYYRMNFTLDQIRNNNWIVQIDI